MSSRALRRLRKDQDLSADLATLHLGTGGRLQDETESKPASANGSVLSQDSYTDSDFDELLATSKRPANAFDMLAVLDDNQGQTDDEEDSSESADESKSIPEVAPTTERTERSPAPSTSSKKKSKKNKKKQKQARKLHGTEQKAENNKEHDDDDFDFNAWPTQQSRPSSEKEDVNLDETLGLLKVDPRNLDVDREVRRLFGSDVIREESREERGAGRYTNPALQRAIASVPGGRLPANVHNMLRKWGGTDGRSVPGMTRKLNMVRIQDSWPPAMHKELSMESLGPLQEGDIDGFHGTAFKFVHPESYIETQSEFHTAVLLGDPQLLMNLLSQHPYHVSTLLQVSEILAHQGQHSESADMIERALFTFERAFLPSFDLLSGKVRLPFRYYENRGFYLTVYKHINVLARRGAWITASEFARLLFALMPGEDPFLGGLMIDYFCIKAQEFDFLINFIINPILRDSHPEWDSYPNLAFSLAIAQLFEDKRKKGSSKNKAHKDLSTGVAEISLGDQIHTSFVKAIEKFPWVASEILSKNGKMLPSNLVSYRDPPADLGQTLLATIYLLRTHDIWTPELIEALENAAQTAKPSKQSIAKKTIVGNDAELVGDIDKRLARHALLTGQAQIVGLLPREVTEMRVLDDDILPPDNSLSPYDSVFAS